MWNIDHEMNELAQCYCFILLLIFVCTGNCLLTAEAVYFLHLMMPSVMYLQLSDVSVTYFQFPIQSAFLP